MKLSDFDANYKVLSFNVRLIVGQKEIIEKATGAFFTLSQRTLFTETKTGETVYFENINVQKPDGTTERVTDICLKIN